MTTQHNGTCQGICWGCVEANVERWWQERQAKEAERHRRSELATEKRRLAAQKEEKELPLRRQLAAQLIDIGFKELAFKLHPDKGGSTEAMARLNNVRRRLRKITP